MARSQDNSDLRDIARAGTAFLSERTPSYGAAPCAVLGGAMVGAPALAAGTGAISPTHAMIAAGSAMLPYGVDLALNNPASRALLAYRYRNPSASVLNRGLVATLAAEQARREAENGR